MIIYNMRERGPYEYDKFVLNILQLYNAVNLSELNELVQANNNTSSLTSLLFSINSLYDNLIGTQSTIGITEKVFTNFYKLKGEN